MPTFGNVIEVRQHWHGPKVMGQVMRAAGRGLEAGAIFLKNRAAEFLSVPAGRARVMIGGTIQYLATSSNVHGAPPRKLSGTLRSRVVYETNFQGLTQRRGPDFLQGGRFLSLEARVGTNVKYGRDQEKGFTLPAGGWFPVPANSVYSVRSGGRSFKLNRVLWIRRKSAVHIQHPWLGPTVERWRGTIGRIIGQGAAMGGP